MKEEKKVEDMTPEEASEELKKTMTKLEKLTPKVEGHLSNIVGRMIRLNKLYYAISKDPEQMKELKETLRMDKSFRRELLETAVSLGSLEGELFKTEELARQLDEELKRKLQEKKRGSEAET